MVSTNFYKSMNQLLALSPLIFVFFLEGRQEGEHEERGKEEDP